MFSDPPLNELVDRQARRALVTLESGRNLPAVGALLADCRTACTGSASALTLSPSATRSRRAAQLSRQVAVTEISGSESFVHVDVGLGIWVCLVAGVHDWQPGAHVEAARRREPRLRLRHAAASWRRAVHRENGLRGGRMARITLDGIAHAYGEQSARPSRTTRSSRSHHVWEQGMAYALLGPSGCGKTTLLNIISGLVIPSEGRLLFDDVDVTHLPTEQRNIAQVFQFPVIYDTMTVAENLAFPLKNRRLAASRDRTRGSPRSRRCST